MIDIKSIRARAKAALSLTVRFSPTSSAVIEASLLDIPALCDRVEELEAALDRAEKVERALAALLRRVDLHFHQGPESDWIEQKEARDALDAGATARRAMGEGK